VKRDDERKKTEDGRWKIGDGKIKTDFSFSIE